MKLSDMINLSFLNIKSNKFKNIIYLLIMLVLFLLLSIVFTGTKSIYNFFSKQLNSNIDLRIISLKLNYENKEKELNNIKSLNLKEVIAYYDSYYLINLSLSDNNDFNFSEYKNPNIAVYEYLDNYNIKVNSGRLIENNGEIICSSSFAPLGYVSDAKDIKNITNKINNNLDINYNKKYYPIKGEEKIIKTYNKSFNLVGTYDIKQDLNYYNVCYISTDDYNEIKKNSLPVWESDEQQINNEKIKSRNAYLIVNDYKNVNKILKILIDKGYDAVVDSELDMELYYLIQNILKYVCLGSIILSIITIYLFIKSIIKENINNIKLYKLLGYDNKLIKNIFKYQYYILTFIAFVLNLFLTPIIKKLFINIMKNSPEINILTININYSISMLFFVFVLIIITIIFNLFFSKLLSLFQFTF